MGRKLDLSGLSDVEAAHVLQVVQRDMRLRKREEERLGELKQELAEEGSRSHLLSRQSCFNQRCCIRCCAPFTFLLNPKRQCGDCGYNVCRSCREYSKKSKGWLCSSCQKHRLLKTQSLEWFYTNVKRRFKRFGSAKVLKTLYKKHLTEHNILSELTDGSGYEGSVCDDGSICGSDSAFYRQSEEHSMSETLTVARRVAEETIDDAISKAEVHNNCQEKQNEAHYLRQHRGELIEELATTIVEKIISRRKTLAQIKSEYDQDLTHTYCDHFVPPNQQGLWRSHSLSLLDTDSHSLNSPPQSLKKEGAGASLSAWKSMDRLDNSVLKSPDGNWIVLQSGQLARPSLLTKRKSQVFSALERESGAVSAYEAMDSDCEPDSSWGAVLKEIHKKMGHSDLLVDLDLDYVGERRGSRDSEGNYWKSNKALKNKVPVEIRKPSSSRRTSIIDINFNVEGGTAEEETRAEPEEWRVRRSRKKRRSKRDANALYAQDHRNTDSASSDGATPETLTSGAMTPDLNNDIAAPEANQINQELTIKLQELTGRASISDSSTNAQNSVLESNSGDYMDLDEGETDDKTEDVDLDDEAKDRLYKLVAQSRLVYLSSTEDDLDKAAVSEEEDTQANLKFKLRRLEQQVKSTEFSSTEDELDRIGLDEDSNQPGEDEEIAVKVRKLVSQVDAAQFSSTEEELDGSGSADEAVDDAALWELQAERGEQVRNLAGLVSICQFSSTEDELDRLGQDETADNDATCIDFDRKESIGELDVNMFELREDCKNMNYLEMSKGGGIEAGDAKESIDFDQRESIGRFDVSMFELNAEGRAAWQGESDGANSTRYKTTTSFDGTFGNEGSLQESVNQEAFLVKEGRQSDSEEDEAEFDRIINSMLMMTLEDMGETSEKQRHSAQSLRSITTEVLKVLNATEQLLRETEEEGTPDASSAPSSSLSQNHRQLDQQLCQLEENVYIAAGSVFGLEVELEDLEQCARAVCSSTSASELSFLEEQVATAAAQVQQSDLQISDISARIAALRSAGLNVDPQPSFTKTRTSPAKSITLDVSRQQRRLLPTPPNKDAKQTLSVLPSISRAFTADK